MEEAARAQLRLHAEVNRRVLRVAAKFAEMWSGVENA
jgi:hypothetical protein